MKEQTKKLVDTLNKVVFDNKISSLVIKSRDFDAEFSYSEPCNLRDYSCPASVDVKVTEKEKYEGNYDPSTEIHVYLKPLRAVYKDGVRVFSFDTLDYFRGYNSEGKTIKVYTNRSLTNEEKCIMASLGSFSLVEINQYF